MRFIESNKSVYIDNYFRPSGRASRSEYWYSLLGFVLAAIALEFLTLPLPLSASILLVGVFNIWALIPGIMVSIRRLHDLDRSGWWVLAPFTIIGAIPLMIFMCLPGTRCSNTYGGNPLDANHPDDEYEDDEYEDDEYEDDEYEDNEYEDNEYEDNEYEDNEYEDNEYEDDEYEDDEYEDDAKRSDRNGKDPGVTRRTPCRGGPTGHSRR